MKRLYKDSGNSYKYYLSSIAVILLSACQSNWTVEPDFGSAVNDSIVSQQINPKAPIGNKKNTEGLDGAAAKASIDAYQKSFQTKPSTGNYPAGGALTPSTGTSTGMGFQ